MPGLHHPLASSPRISRQNGRLRLGWACPAELAVWGPHGAPDRPLLAGTLPLELLSRVLLQAALGEGVGASSAAARDWEDRSARKTVHWPGLRVLVRGANVCGWCAWLGHPDATGAARS